MKLTEEKMLSMYKLMYTTRKFEEKCVELNKAKEIIGSIHPSIGEEATSVGLAAVLNDDDVLAPSYRDVGALFTKGLTVLDLMGMLFGKACGKTEGKTRVLHVGDLKKNILPPNPILGASSAIAIGAAFVFKKDKASRVVVNALGDGASNEGAVHEAMNFAAAKELPIVFVIENNRYAWSTPYESNFKIPSLSFRSFAYGMPGFVADGNDILDVFDVMSQAVDYARNGNGPSLVECRTYRWGGHSGNDKNVYRSLDEIIRWRQDCPIDKFENYMINVGVCTKGDIEGIQKAVEDEIEDALKTSKEADYPDVNKINSIHAMMAVE